MERQAKGIWIPIEIWESKELTWNEKILFLEIDSFTSKDKDCFFSNEYIANLLGVTENSANRILSSLISKGYVIKTTFDGRRRFVKTAFSYDKADYSQMNKLPIQESVSSLNNGEYIPNTSNNTDNKPNKEEEKKEWRDSFEVYLALVNKSKQDVMSDSEYRQYIEKYYSNADYDATLNKLIDGFWGKIEGWEFCKAKRKGKTINMTSALKKNMDRRDKIVYKQKQSNNQQKYVSSQQTVVSLHPKLKIIDEEGTLSDGTFLKNGYRYYFSKQQGQAFSIPPSAEPMPQGVNVEYDYKFGWYECE